MAIIGRMPKYIPTDNDIVGEPQQEIVHPVEEKHVLRYLSAPGRRGPAPHRRSLRLMQKAGLVSADHRSLTYTGLVRAAQWPNPTTWYG